MRRWQVLVACTALVGLAAGIGWIYTHPPLYSTGLHERHSQVEITRAYGLDLENGGRWPLTLIAVKINGKEIDYPQAMAVANLTDSHLAGNAAIMVDKRHKLQTGPVNGWQMRPKLRLQRLGSYGLLLEGGDVPPDNAEVIIHYRYLGLPMQYAGASRWFRSR